VERIAFRLLHLRVAFNDYLPDGRAVCGGEKVACPNTIDRCGSAESVGRKLKKSLHHVPCIHQKKKNLLQKKKKA